MLNSEIEQCCKRLKLSQNLAEQAQTIEGDSHQEYLYKLLKAELEHRDEVRKNKLISSAGFYTLRTFEGFRLMI